MAQPTEDSADSATLLFLGFRTSWAVLRVVARPVLAQGAPEVAQPVRAQYARALAAARKLSAVDRATPIEPDATLSPEQTTFLVEKGRLARLLDQPGGEEESSSFAPAVGTVQVEWDGPPAAVLVDGHAWGTTEDTLTLEAGNHEIGLAREAGAQPASSVVSVPEGDGCVVRFTRSR